MNTYEAYKNAKDAVNSLIDNKQNEIECLEKEIFNLRQTRRMLDTEFQEEVNKKEDYLG